MPSLEPERRPPGRSPTRPFLGPSPFTEEDHALFFGRSADLTRLRSLLRTERIVVLHSPSGAGKTSLIQAGLLPMLRQDGFRVFPTIRVGLPLPASKPAVADANRYAYSAVYSLESGFSAEGKYVSGLHSATELAGIRLSTYFAHRTAAYASAAGSRLLVFDQFEELFTRSPRDHAARVEFFTDLANVLRDKSMWALFTMREEYVAALDLYKHLLPAQLAARYHLDFLTPEGARQAITEPARQAGVTIEDEALDAILADLSGARRAPSAPAAVEDAAWAPPFDATPVDPLHLQLVCVDAWDHRPPGADRIGRETVESLRTGGRDTYALTAVDWALLRYYDQTVRSVCEGTPELERRVRSWIDDSLVDHGRFRRQAIAEGDDGDFREAQSALENEHILRANVRIGTTWYEIAHDRMVAPLRRSNDAWYDANLDRFAQQARKWHAAGSPQDFETLSRRELDKLGYGKTRPAGKKTAALPLHEQQYLDFCHAQARRRWRRFAVAGLLLAAVLSGAYLSRPYFKAKYQERLAAAEDELSKVKGQTSQLKAEEKDILTQRRTAQKTAQLLHLYSQAMTQRYRFENHDVALLLARRAIGENATLPLSARLSPLYLESAVWTAMEAVPFSQTLPPPVLGGNVTSLATRGSRFYVTVDGKAPGPRLAEVDAASRGLAFEGCRPGAELSADGLLTATAEDGRRELLDANDCRLLGHTPAELTLAQRAPEGSPDGRHLAIFLKDGAAVVYTAGGEHQVARFAARPKTARAGRPGPDSFAVTALAFHDGLVAAGDAGGTVRFAPLTRDRADIPQPVTAWQPYWPYPPPVGHAATTEEDTAIVAMAFLALPDGAGSTETWLCLVHRGGIRTRGGKIFLYRLADPSERYQLVADSRSLIREGVMRELGRAVERPGGEAVADAHFSAGRRWLVAAGDKGAVTHWDLRSPVFERLSPDELEGEQRESAACDADDPTTTCVNVARAPRTLLRGAPGSVSVVRVSDDGRQVASVQRDAAVRLWHLMRPAIAYRATQWGEGYVYGLTFDPKNLLIATNNRGTVQAWRVSAAGGEGCPAPAGQPPALCAVATGAARPLLGKSGNSIRSVDAAGDLLVLATTDPTPRIWRRSDPAFDLVLVDRAAKHTGGLWSAALRPGNEDLGARYDLATGDEAGTLILWDLVRSGRAVAPGEPALAVALGGEGLTGIAFHPRGRWLAAATRSGGLHLVDMDGRACASPAAASQQPTPCLAPSPPGAPATLYAVAWNAVGDRLAAAGDGLSWWPFEPDAKPPTSLEHPVPGAVGPVHAVAFVPRDENVIATTEGASVLLRTLDDETMQPVELHAEGVELFSLAVRSDGTLLAAGDGKGRFMIWDLDPTQHVCRLVPRDLSAQEWSTLVGGERQAICP